MVTRDQLLESVWKYESTGETNIVDVYIRYLRGKIDLPGQKSYIKTVRGIGYAHARHIRIKYFEPLEGSEYFYDSRETLCVWKGWVLKRFWLKKR